MAILIIFLVFAIVASICFVIGLGPIAIVPLVLAILAAGWAFVAFLRGVTISDAVRNTHKAELLGPGGADDPDQAR